MQDISSFLAAIRVLEECIADIRAWMALNKLMFNDSKAEFQVIVPRNYLAKFSDLSASLRVGNASVFSSKKVRDLGVMFDSEMTMASHVGNIVCSMYMQMKSIGRIRHHLDQATCAKVVMALVTSRLDYANSALYGITDSLLYKLQLAQNNAARLTTRTKKVII